MTNTAIPGHLVARLRPVGPTGLTTSQLRALLSSDSTFDEVVDQLVEAVEPGQLVALIRTRILRARQALVRQRDEIDDALTWLQVSIKAGDPITPSRNGRTGAGLTQSDLRSLERIATAARTKLADQDVDGEEIAAATSARAATQTAQPRRPQPSLHHQRRLPPRPGRQPHPWSVRELSMHRRCALPARLQLVRPRSDLVCLV